MALGSHQEQPEPGGPRPIRQPCDAWLGELLRPILPVEVCSSPSPFQRDPRGLDATEIQTVSTSRTCVHALAGAHCATGPDAFCPVAARREAGGWIVGAV